MLLRTFPACMSGLIIRMLHKQVLHVCYRESMSARERACQRERSIARERERERGKESKSEREREREREERKRAREFLFLQL